MYTRNRRGPRVVPWGTPHVSVPGLDSFPFMLTCCSRFDRCATDDVREYLHFLHVSAGEVIGCDGHRIHWGATELDDGSYCPRTMLRVMHNYTVPDFNRVKHLPFAVKYETYLVGDGVPGDVTDAKGAPVLDFGKCCRIVAKYLADAVGKNADGAELTVEPGESPRVAGSTVWGRYLIMGMRK